MSKKISTWGQAIKSVTTKMLVKVTELIMNRFHNLFERFFEVEAELQIPHCTSVHNVEENLWLSHGLWNCEFTFILRFSLWYAQRLKEPLSLVFDPVKLAKQSIFIILAQIFKQSVKNKSPVKEHSESTQRQISEHSEHQNKSHYNRSL